jgi:hypothetical protein
MGTRLPVMAQRVHGHHAYVKRPATSTLRDRTRSAGTFPTKREADRAWQDAEAELRRGRVGDPASGRRTFRDYVGGAWLPNRRLSRARARSTRPRSTSTRCRSSGRCGCWTPSGARLRVCGNRAEASDLGAEPRLNARGRGASGRTSTPAPGTASQCCRPGCPARARGRAGAPP